jgi:putative spermidine/putrescine transport system ATP-binding protein
VASFVGRSNRLEGVADGDRVDAAGVVLRAAQAAHGPVELMIRPQRIEIGPPGDMRPDGETVNRVPGRVIRSVFAGDLIQSDVQVGGVVLTVEQPNRAGGHAEPTGREVELRIRPADIMLFPAPA